MKHEQINNRKELEVRRKELRNKGTSAEAILWTMLKGKQLDGKKFRRQHSVGNYILDFYCPAVKLAIELDGDSHFTMEGMKYDEVRTRYLNSLNIHVIRFLNGDVFENPKGVVEKIRCALTTPVPPPAELTPP
jgi:very-short-patch-repair endonuclease